MSIDEVYDVLVQECGAPESQRELFVRSWDPDNEYRFSGALGFGGKLRPAHYGLKGWRVDCYLEDLTDERREMITKANNRLAERSN